ncbi:MAG: hypothetical protein JWQ50_8692 [Caballeronia mineralivorans]|jgi:hypothetical protein|nr:hypothetical protein [Caballeronia mineralivorans]MEA3101527.1 hypothetical protein [Caballeronia mineralivorans]
MSGILIGRSSFYACAGTFATSSVCAIWICKCLIDEPSFELARIMRPALAQPRLAKSHRRCAWLPATI